MHTPQSQRPRPWHRAPPGGCPGARHRRSDSARDSLHAAAPGPLLQGRQTTAGATVTSRHFPFCSEHHPLNAARRRGLPGSTQIPNRRPTANPLGIISLGTPPPPPPRFSEDQADAIHWSSPEK
ncbi:hypothetical protein MG293_011224 [Ovis ammon polii]|uniref:Uncharacterized protein n=1 Tax=Ovis ammon polii TaxID=230172 RepID=A0AAD4U624_OVIAM|nr:hypothetical protein MG293_011224 [Ovis ammon polii]